MKQPTTLKALFVLCSVAGTTQLTLEAQPAPQARAAVVLGDLSRATVVQVRDASGQVVLQGQFGVDDENDETEREAKLAPTGVDPDAEGKAEADVPEAGRSSAQELEVEVNKLAPNARFVVVIDGRDIAPITTDARGHADVEWKDGAAGSGSGRSEGGL